MKKKISLWICCAVLLLFILCLCTGCGSQQQEETPDIESIDITLTIDYPQKSNRTDIIEVPFCLEEDTTVLQLIELYGNVNNLPVLVDTTHSTLEAINGVQNGIFWKKGEWKFMINGKYTTKAENETLLENGDILKFTYVKH